MFYIDAVHFATDYNGTELYIKSVKGTTKLDETSTTIYTKESVINFINDGNSVKTKYYRNGKWNIGEDVRVVDNSYLRTDANNIKADNLGSLPRY